MTEERDRIYRKCLSGSVPVEQMRELARAFEKARCFPQARMLRLRIDLEELPEEIKAIRQETFQRAMASRKIPGILKVAQAFEDYGATSSAAKLRRHAEAVAKDLARESLDQVITPEPQSPPPESVLLETAADSVPIVEVITNGQTLHTHQQPYVAVSETLPIAN